MPNPNVKAHEGLWQLESRRSGTTMTAAAGRRRWMRGSARPADDFLGCTIVFRFD
jgi:hypothetical protein